MELIFKSEKSQLNIFTNFKQNNWEKFRRYWKQISEIEIKWLFIAVWDVTFNQSNHWNCWKIFFVNYEAFMKIKILSCH